MDETKELLRAVLGRIEEVSATVTGIEKDLATVKTDLAAVKTDLADFRRETGEHFSRIDKRVAHLGEQWIELDHQVWLLRREKA